MSEYYASLEQLLEEINKLTVPALREVARDFGIVPRNRKREELITLIVASYNGQLQPEERIKTGRPTKGRAERSVRQNLQWWTTLPPTTTWTNPFHGAGFWK